MQPFSRLAALMSVAAFACGASAQEPVARVEVASYRQLSADVMALGMHVQNPMLNMGLMFLGNLVGAPGLLGVDQERPIRLAVFADNGNLDRAERVLVLPVLADGAQYLEALKANYTSVEDDGKVRRYRANRDVQSFREMSVVLVGGYAVVSPSKPLLDRVAGWLKDDPDHLAIDGIAGSVLLCVDAGVLAPVFRKNLDEQARAADATAAEGPQAAVADMMRLYADVGAAFLEQARTLKLAAQCNEQGLTLYGRVEAVPESTLAKVCADAKPCSERLRRLLPADASMVYATGAIGAVMRNLKEPYLAFARKIMDVQQRMMAQLPGNAGMPSFDFGKLLEQSDWVWEAYQGDFVLSMGVSPDGKSPVLFEAMTIKDGPKLLDEMGANLTMVNEMYASMKMPLRIVQRESRKSGETEIRVYAAEIVPPPPKDAAAKPDKPEAAEGEKDGGEDEDQGIDEEEMQALMAEAMAENLEWLTKGVMELAVVDDVMMVAAGTPGCLDPFVAKAHNPPEDTWTARSQALFPDIKNHDKAVEFWNLNLLSFLKGFAGLLPEVADNGELMAAIAQLPNDGAGMGGVTMCSPTAAMGAFRLSAAQLGAIVRSAQTLQRLGRQAAAERGGRPAEAPAGPPVEVVIPEN